jgi:hypothetical protein
MSGYYSTAPEAQKKKDIDAKIGGTMDLTNEGYLKALIKEASKGAVSVSDKAGGLQFFIVKGGGEGFLDATHIGKNASRMEQYHDTTAASGIEMIFDDNDLLAVFGRDGTLIGAAVLSRPIFVAPTPGQSGLREITANSVYDAWDGQPVSIYRNERFTVKYYGLAVDDSLGKYRSGAVRIDLHKEEDTNGCIFIKDKDTPSTDHLPLLNGFEPKLILAIQKAIGAKTKSNIGTMRMIDIS